MVIPNAEIAPQPLRTTDGQVFAYFVPAEEMNRLRGEIESLREQLSQAERQRDHNLAKVKELLTTRFPLLPTPEEMADPSLWATSEDIRQIITDAHLAALAIEHGLTLNSTDGDFARFPGLNWRNPLAA